MRPRLTIRWLMLLVVGAAVLLRLLIVAAQVVNQPNYETLSHLGRFRDTGAAFVHNHVATPGQHWAEYWRRALGLPWPGGYACPCKAELEAQTGQAAEFIETSHDMDALDRRMAKM